MLKVKRWEEFQHYKDRRPPWIKLYRKLLDDPEWFKLPPDAFKLLVALWLMASESMDGSLPDIKVIAFRYRVDIKEATRLLSMLSEWVEGFDIKMISDRYQGDSPETETERETEKRERKTVAPVGAPAPVVYRVPVDNAVETVDNLKPIERRKPNTPQAEFVERFKASYEAMTGQPFKFKKEHFIIADKLIKEYGAEMVIVKAKTLGGLCRDRSVWFTKEGWADFSIEKLSSMWNAIIPGNVEDPAEKKRRDDLEAMRKVREENERVDSAIGR